MSSILKNQLSSPWLSKRTKGVQLYAMVDCTKQTQLFDNFPDDESQYISLFDTEDDYELEKISPYIVLLDENSDLRNWLIDVWGEKQSGFFFYSNCQDIEELYKHFVTFTEVTKKDSPTYFFNFYNPLSLSIWLESMPLQSRLEFFKPIQSIVLESPIQGYLKVMELDITGVLITSDVLENNKCVEVKCYKNSLERSADQKTERNLPWLLSDEENEAIPKISKYNFMLDVTKKMWAYDSIKNQHGFKELLKKVQSWTDNLAKKNIIKRKDVALFLILLAKYEKQWQKHANKINVILSDKEESSARIKYLNIRDIVAIAE